jgi:phosphoribosylglycinamide formyltransferase-1
MKLNIAVFASGKGSNFSAISKAVDKGIIKARLALLVCDNAKAPVLEKARKARVKSLIIAADAFPSKEEFEKSIISHLKEEKINLIVLAGFMRILSPAFVRAFSHRILNIHPALLPSFKGSSAIKDAFAYGAKATGVTVHFVDEKVDHGPIILQECVPIAADDDLGSLEAKIHRLEHRMYPRAIKLLLEKKLKVAGRKVRIISR